MGAESVVSSRVLNAGSPRWVSKVATEPLVPIVDFSAIIDALALLRSLLWDSVNAQEEVARLDGHAALFFFMQHLETADQVLLLLENMIAASYQTMVKPATSNAASSVTAGTAVAVAGALGSDGPPA